MYAIWVTVQESEWEIMLSPEQVAFKTGKASGQWPVAEIKALEHVIQKPESDTQQPTHRLNLLHSNGKKVELLTLSSTTQDPATDMQAVTDAFRELIGKEVETQTA